MPTYLHTASGAYDLPAILRRAWNCARNLLKLHTSIEIPSTLRACFARTLRETWDAARSYRALAQWQAQRDADGKAAQALDVRSREIRSLKIARTQAIGIDNARAYRAEVSAINARLDQLQAAA